MCVVTANNEGVYSDDFKAHHFNYPINRCDEIAQVSVFLGVVGVVLFGLSQRTGEFVLGIENSINSVGGCYLR